ncbi:hypothetical protein P153DRAFT_341906 [Dothidotthia symphoricarpi CBS 119687]|uniref:Derlin n=1 Tax=Dothidotthia symphoricarpi CBS 119687 TaxID=1392245 RepID=A0A6A6A941_9PLEO|nr:uncharacterized protein P153DRAFT_341906 [Dothidotthia symphoricarpi CBS 119687]KAF2128330.1 hypothetical protein P153DRAFT_341906 [Dothidotthia symphoricarpi CBS 119687]
MDVFWTLPPVSRTITALAVVVSALGYGGIISLGHYIFATQFVFTVKIVPQVWRVFTAFLITKPKFAILLDPYFLYQYGSAIERESTRFAQPGDFFVYTAFVGTVIAVSPSAYMRVLLLSLAEAIPGIEEEYPCTSCGSVIRIIQKGLVRCVSMVGLPLEKVLRILQFRWAVLAPYIPLPIYTFSCDTLAGVILNGYTFLPALSLAYAYTFAQDSPTRQVSFFVINFDAKYLPFAMLFMTFIIDGPDAALSQVTGIIAAHLFDFLTRIWPTFGGGKNYIFTPQIVKRWFGARPGVAQARGYGHAVDNRARATPDAPSAGRSTGSQWNGLGPGRRLGE